MSSGARAAGVVSRRVVAKKSRSIVSGEINQALQNLLLPKYAGIKDVFGEVLVKRSRQRHSNCFTVVTTAGTHNPHH